MLIAIWIGVGVAHFVLADVARIMWFYTLLVAAMFVHMREETFWRLTYSASDWPMYPLGWWIHAEIRSAGLWELTFLRGVNSLVVSAIILTVVIAVRRRRST